MFDGIMNYLYDNKMVVFAIIAVCVIIYLADKRGKLGAAGCNCGAKKTIVPAADADADASVAEIAQHLVDTGAATK